MKLVEENWKCHGWIRRDGGSAENKATKEHLFEFTTEGNYGLGMLLPWQRGDNALSALESQY